MEGDRRPRKNSFLSGLASMESLLIAGGNRQSLLGQGYWASCHAVLGRVSDFGRIAYIRSFRPSDFPSFLQSIHSCSSSLEADLIKESFSRQQWVR